MTGDTTTAHWLVNSFGPDAAAVISAVVERQPLTDAQLGLAHHMVAELGKHGSAPDDVELLGLLEGMFWSVHQPEPAVDAAIAAARLLMSQTEVVSAIAGLDTTLQRLGPASGRMEGHRCGTLLAKAEALSIGKRSDEALELLGQELAAPSNRYSISSQFDLLLAQAEAAQAGGAGSPAKLMLAEALSLAETADQRHRVHCQSLSLALTAANGPAVERISSDIAELDFAPADDEAVIDLRFAEVLGLLV